MTSLIIADSALRKRSPRLGDLQEWIENAKNTAPSARCEVLQLAIEDLKCVRESHAQTTRDLGHPCIYFVSSSVSMDDCFH
jgi:hypothetical protein